MRGAFKTQPEEERSAPEAAAVSASRKASAHLIRVPEAARLTGLPRSTMRKSFMREDRRPKNVPPPPPHVRVGRAVYILADKLDTWIMSIGAPIAPQKRTRGRPTVAERIALRERAS